MTRVGALLAFLILVGFATAGPGFVAVVNAAPHPALLSVQWAWSATGTIADRCDAPNGGGYSCLKFPDGGSLYAVEWQSTVKTPCNEVLIMLNVSGNGQPLYVHHVAWGALQPAIIRSLRLSPPLAIAPGGAIWLTAVGGSLCNFAHPLNAFPVEVQTTVIVDGTASPGHSGKWKRVKAGAPEAGKK